MVAKALPIYQFAVPGCYSDVIKKADIKILPVLTYRFYIDVDFITIGLESSQINSYQVSQSMFQ